MALIRTKTDPWRLSNSLTGIFHSNLPKTAVLGLSIGIIITCWKNYRDWRSAGLSGLPPTVSGWVRQWLARLYASRDTLSTSCYSDPSIVGTYGDLGTKRFIIEDLPQRSGDRPALLPWVIPHRQTAETASDKRIRDVGLASLVLDLSDILMIVSYKSKSSSKSLQIIQIQSL
jgi:hypothetical protein